MNLHGSGQQYTPKQDSIQAFLNTRFAEDGSYLIPNYPKGTSYEEMQKSMPSMQGKPWILLKMTNAGFGRILVSCLLIGLIVFLNSPYTVHIWYPKSDIGAHLTDALLSWGLCGL